MNVPRFFPEVLELPDAITDYDRANFLTYARILDVADGRTAIDGWNWREAALIILGRDPDADEAAAWRCWDAHLARARWLMSGTPKTVLRPGASVTRQ